MNLGLYVAIGVILLGLALAYAALRNKTRDHRIDPVRDEAIRDQYRENGSTSGAPSGRMPR